MIRDPVGFRLALSSRAENMAVVRAAIAGIAESLRWGDELTSDLKTAVSEACNNVVLHAYPDTVGPMWVDVDCFETGVRVRVTDHGRGITRIASGDQHMGLGLAVINALSDRSQYARPDAGGAEVSMWFGVTPDTGLGAAPSQLPAETDGHVVLWCSSADLQRPILARVLWHMAASAHFSLDGIGVVREVTDVLTNHVSRGGEAGWAGARIHSTIPRELELTVGPFPPLGWDPALARHVDGFEVEAREGQELLHFRVTDNASQGVRED